MLASKCLQDFRCAIILSQSTHLPTTPLVTETTENNDVPVQNPFKRGSLPHWEYIAIFLVIVLIAGIRFRLRDFPLERDEGEYAYAGQLILKGIPPYELAYNMKLPGTYLAYAGILAAFGQTAGGVHLGLILVNSAAILLLFFIAKRLFGSSAAVVAGATYGFFTIRPLTLGLAGHATHFVVLFALASILLLLKAVGTDRILLFFFSGICAGLAFLMKQPGIFLGIFAGLYLSWREWPPSGLRRNLLSKLAVYSAGVVLPYALTCLWLYRAGVFKQFWFWTVLYAREYGSELSVSVGLHQFANRMVLLKDDFEFIWALIVFGIVAFLWNGRAKPHAAFILGFLGFSFLSVSVGLYYRGHYFIMLYPVLSLLAGVGVSAAAEGISRFCSSRACNAIPGVLFAIALAYALYADRQTFFLDAPNAACRYVYGGNPFPESIEIAKYIRTHSSPDARIAVLGSEPQIYFYAQRLSATGYIYTYALVEEQRYSSVMQAEMIKEVESAKPEILVDVLRHESWLTKAHADQKIFDWRESYAKEHYTLEGIADGGNHDVYRWGPDASTYRPRTPECVLVFRRNP